MLFYTVQEIGEKFTPLLALARSIAITNPGHDLCIMCEEAAQTTLESCQIQDITLSFLRPPNELTKEGFVKNWLHLTEHVVGTHKAGIFVSSQNIVCGPIQVTAEIEKQGFGFIKKEFFVANQYSFGVLYIASPRMLSKIKGKCEEALETGDADIIKTWSEIPGYFVEYDDGVDCAESFFEGKGVFSTENAIANKGWEAQKVKVDPLSYDDTPMYVATLVLDKRAIQINQFIVNALVTANDRFIPVIESMTSVDPQSPIYTPPMDGIAHWDRSADIPLKQLLDIIPNTVSKPHPNGQEYFECAKYVLYDKPGIKWVTNSLKKHRGVLYYDYDNEMVEFWKTFEKPAVFGGYVAPHHAVLDGFVRDAAVEKSGTVSAGELPTSFGTEEDYNAHLAKLDQYETCEIDSSTPKYRIAECLKLGVKPLVVDDTVIIDSDKLDDAYYESHLSLSAMRSTFLKTVF